MVFDLDLDESAVFAGAFWCVFGGMVGRGEWACSGCLSENLEGVVIVCFDVDGFDCCAGDVAEEVVIVSILLKIKSRNEAVHETMTPREMTIEFIEIIQNR
jgi:hypothetical protein